MSLFEDAATDFQEIMNSDLGASVSCVITDPCGAEETLLCRHSDTSQVIDPGTNEAVSGRRIVLSVCLADLYDVGFEKIRGIEKKDEKPWKVAVSDIAEIAGVYKVSESNPDASIGSMVLHCEVMV